MRTYFIDSTSLGSWFNVTGWVDEDNFILEQANSCDELGNPRTIEKGSDEWERLEAYCDHQWPEFVLGKEPALHWEAHAYTHFPHLIARRYAGRP